MAAELLKPVDLSPPPGFTADLWRTLDMVAVVSVRGLCPRGSAGSPHAEYLIHRLVSGVLASEARGLVLDLREMEYTMGNSMGGVFQTVDMLVDSGMLAATPQAFVTVTSDRCHDGIVSLVTPDYAPVPAWIFSDFESAYAACAKAVDPDLEDEDGDGPARPVPPLKMYILVREDVPPGFAVLAAAHASLAGYLRFRTAPEVREWIAGPFRKVVCTVSAEEFERARQVDGHVVLTESALGDREVAMAFRPRREWPPLFGSLRLYGRG